MVFEDQTTISNMRSTKKGNTQSLVDTEASNGLMTPVFVGKLHSSRPPRWHNRIKKLQQSQFEANCHYNTHDPIGEAAYSFQQTENQMETIFNSMIVTKRSTE